MDFKSSLNKLEENFNKVKKKKIDRHNASFQVLKKEVGVYTEAMGNSYMSLDNFSAKKNNPKRDSSPKGFFYGYEVLQDYNNTDKIEYPRIYEFMKWPATAIEVHSEYAYMMFNFAIRAIASYLLGDCNVYLLDSNISGDFNRFSLISTDVDDIDTEKNYFHYITADDDKKKMLESLFDIMDRNIRNCCRTYPDLYSYNSNNELMYEPYNFVFIRDISNVLIDRSQFDLLTRMVSKGNAAKSGIFLFFSYDKNIIENANDSYYNDNVQSLQQLLGVSHVFDPSSRCFEPSELKVEQKAPWMVVDEVVNYVRTASQPKIVTSFKNEIKQMLDSGILWNNKEKKGHLFVPVGFRTAVEKMFLDISFNTSPHIYIGGQTGSGKSILLHNIILNSALRYSPEQLRFYLADMKGGVSFAGYKKLPHVAALSASSSRHYAESLLSLFAEEIDNRASIFRRYGVTSLEQYNDRAQTQGLPIMPYNCAIIDEFQGLFMENDNISRNAQKLIEHIHRTGRSQGVFLILCTQRPPSNIDRSQVGIKLALKCQPNDSNALIGNNGASRLKEYRAIVNTSVGGEEDKNQEFHTSYIDEKNELPVYVNKINDIWLTQNNGVDPLERMIYDDNELDVPVSSEILLDNRENTYVNIWLGVPAFYRKEHVKFQLHRDSQNNVAVVGNDRPSALRIAGMTVLQMIEAYRNTVGCKVYISDLQRQSEPTYGKLSFLTNCTDGVVQYGFSTTLKDTIDEVYALYEQRCQNRDQSINEPEVLYVILDLKPDSNFIAARTGGVNFGMSVEKTNLQKLHELIVSGPDLGVHVMAYSYNYSNISQLLNDFGDPLLNMMMEVKIGLRGGQSNKMFNYGNGEIVSRNGEGFIRIPEDMGLYYKDGDNFGDPFRIYDVIGNDKLKNSAWETLFNNLPNKND